MASQSVILPTDESLFITDKSWLRPRKSPKPGQSSFSLAQPSEIDGLSVTVVKTNFKCGRKGSKEPAHADETPLNRGLQFVNTTQTKRGKRDAAEQRKIVRSHVMTGTRRRAPAISAKPPEPDGEDVSTLPPLDTDPDESFDEEISSSQSAPLSTCSSASFHPTLSLLPSGTTTPLYGRTPFPIHPSFHRLLTYYSTATALALYPLQPFLTFNPVRQHWFPTALTDEVLLHTIMYSAALGLSLSPSPPADLSLTALVSPILRLLSTRLSTPFAVSDGTIAAVSCLVMVETQRGNSDKSALHLQGLSQMIRARGGMENVSPDLVTKIARADSERSVDNLTMPVLPMVRRVAPPLYETLPLHARFPPSPTFMAILTLPDVVAEPHLASTMRQLAELAVALNYYTAPSPSPFSTTPRINPRSYDEDLLSLSARFLALFTSHNTPTPTSRLIHPLILASLIFTKSLSRPLTFPPTGSELLAEGLHQSMLHLFPDRTTTSTSHNPPNPPSFPLPLPLFLLTIGALSSQSSTPSSIYFTTHLTHLLHTNPHITSWPTARLLLREILFVDVVHELPYQQLWMQLVKMCELKRRWDAQVGMGGLGCDEAGDV
jgi:hypothetical protein